MTTALSLYGTQTVSTPLATADRIVTATGGTASSKTTLIGTSTGYGELYSQGKASAWAAAGSLPAPSGHGFLFDATTLEGQTLLGGAPTLQVRGQLSVAATLVATLYGRLYKRSSGGVYTLIGSANISAPYSTSATTYTLTFATLNMQFGTGDKLYVDVFLNITSNTGGTSLNVIKLYTASTATGLAQYMQLITPGYAPTVNKDALSRFNLGIPVSKDALARLGLTTTYPFLVAGAGTASGTLATAGTMATTINGPNGTTAASVVVGVATGWGEIWWNVNAGAWAALGAIGAPTGHGFLYDVTSLEGQQLLAGNWTPTLRFGGLSSGTLTAGIVTRVYKRSSGGTYTLILSSTLAAQTFAPSWSNYFLPDTAGSAMQFGTGDKLYVDIWLNITANTTGSGTATLVFGDVTADIAKGSPDCAWISPGYIPIQMNDTLTRFGVQIGATNTSRDALSRLRLLASKSVDTLSRLRLQSAPQFKDTLARFRLQSSVQVKDAASRFRQLATKSVGASNRFRVQSTQTYHDVLARFRLLATSLRDTPSRLRLQSASIAKDTANRFRMSATVLRDSASRLRLLALKSVNVAARFRVQSVIQVKDTLSRLRVQSGTVGRDTLARFRLVIAAAKDSANRFRLQSALITKDASSRFRLQVVASRTLDVLTRLRLQSAQLTRDTVTRLRLLATKSADTLSRFRLSATANKDAPSRFRVLASKSLDALSRFRQLATKSVDVSARFRLLSTKSRDALARFRVQSPQVIKEAASRFRVQSATIGRDAASRFKLGIPRALDGLARLRLLATRSVDTLSRFRLQTVGQVSLNALSRLRLLASKSVDVVSRLRLQSGTIYKHAVTRFRLQSGVLAHDTATRLRLQSASVLRDALARFRLVIVATKNVSSRFRMQSGGTLHDAQSRMRVQSGTQFKQVLGRFRLSIAGITRDAVSRYRLLATKSVNVVSRLRVQSAPQFKDTVSRFKQQSGAMFRDGRARFRLFSTQKSDLLARFRLSLAGSATRDTTSRFRLIGNPTAMYAARGTMLNQATRGTEESYVARGTLELQEAR